MTWACFSQTEVPLLELLVAFSKYTQDHLTFLSCMVEEEGKITTGSRKDEKNYFVSSLIAAPGSLTWFSLKSSP